MKKSFIKLLSVLVAFGLAKSALGLTIIPTFDASITNDPNGAAMTNAIYNAIAVFQSKIADDQIVRIHFTNDPTVGLGQSSTFGGDYVYADYIAALRSHATSVNDTNGLSKIPAGPTDPVLGSTGIHMNLALAVLMGLDSGYGDDGQDSTIALKMSLMNFTRPPLDPDKYDLAQVAEHEIDEVLGSPSNLPNSTNISPMDLFRYTTNRVRTYTTNGDDAYFSVDGTNLLARFNMDAGGDYADWWSVNFPTNWSPATGITTYFAQVQDAFSGPGNDIDLGPAELAMEDVLGWTLITPSKPAPALKIVRSGLNQFTLSWTNIATGYVLQESTNLSSVNSWIVSLTGATNPAVLVSTDTAKFYRLYSPVPSPHVVVSEPKVARVKSTTPHSVTIHITRPSPL